MFKIDVVLQATGMHAHAVSNGVVNSLSRLGLLGRVFKPKAEWEQIEPAYDDGLFDYLSAPECAMMIFLGFDWHSQSLHSTLRWRTRIRTSPCVKIGYFHETLLNGSDQEKRDKENAVRSCFSLINIIWHASPAEATFVQELIDFKRPVFCSGFAVDTDFFNSRCRRTERSGFAFFRGKLNAFSDPTQYQERRDLVEYLSNLELIDVKDYNPFGFSDEQLVEEYNNYKVCIDPPSVFSGPTTRVFEALACGCVVFSHARNFSYHERQKLEPLLRTFTTIEDLSKQLIDLRRCDKNTSIEEERLLKIREHISLDSQLKSLVDKWCSILPDIKIFAPIVRVYDHPYHTLTKSQQFLLEKFSDLNTITITCDTDNRAPLAYQSPTYQLGCYMEIGWQTVHIYPHFFLPDRRTRVLIPMFDGSNHRPDRSFPVPVEYVSFSKSLDARLKRLDLSSMLVCYYPDSDISLETRKKSIERTLRRSKNGSLKAYFWQRTSQITLSTAIKICKQLGCFNLVVNVHHDPGQVDIQTAKDGIYDGVEVKTHGWLEKKSSMLKLLDECDIYIAPRSCEGIGMGFLEAMSRGLCVIGYDAPTMNEYIIDGENGLLYDDIENPKISNKFEIHKIRQRVFEDSEDLSSNWNNQLNLIVNKYHPYHYSCSLKWLRDNGVMFRKQFDFKIPIDRV